MYVDIQFKLNAAIASAVTVTMRTELKDPDAGDDEYTSGNLNSTDQYENFIGVTDVSTRIVAPTTGEGLASVATIASSAVVSNTTSV